MTKKPSLISTRRLFTVALTDFWHWKKQLLLVVAVLAVPLTLLGVVANLNQDATFAAYSSFLTLIMNLALLWVIVRSARKESVTMRGAYYEGSAPLVKFLLVAVLLALMLIPFSLGALIYLNGVTGATLVATTSEKFILGLVWAVLALPSVLLLTRYFLSIYIVIEPESRPLASMRASSRLVKGRTWRVMGRMAAIGFVSLIILAVPTALTTLSSSSLVSTFLLAIVQLLSTLLVLPVSNIYLYRLYQDLAQ